MNRAEMIADLREKRQTAVDTARGIAATVKKHNRKMSAGERQRFEDAENLIGELDERIGELVAQEEADQAAATNARKYAPKFGDGVTSEPQVYRNDAKSPSFFRDLFNATRRGDFAALERLERNNRMVAEKRAISTTNGAGGEFVPPLWLEDEWVKYVRPGRVTANLALGEEMPPGTDVINIPKVVTGTDVEPMSGQNTGIQQTDLTTTSIVASVLTIAGGQTISLQLMEQSPLNIDKVVLGDLAADYAMKADLQVINGSGSAGQAMGLLNLAGTNSVTWTQTTPAVGGPGGLYAKIGAAVSAVNSARYLPANVIIMHPRRWAWIESQSDNSGRPLVVPGAQGPWNAAGVAENLAAEGRVGTLMGMAVYTDANIPTNLGTGTNQDVIIVARSSDLYLWESVPRAETFEQTYANNMSVLCRFYAYLAWQPGRYPQSIATITGTGAVTPAF